MTTGLFDPLEPSAPDAEPHAAAARAMRQVPARTDALRQHLRRRLGAVFNDDITEHQPPVAAPAGAGHDHLAGPSGYRKYREGHLVRQSRRNSGNRRSHRPPSAVILYI